MLVDALTLVLLAQLLWSCWGITLLQCQIFPLSAAKEECMSRVYELGCYELPVAWMQVLPMVLHVQ
jgi:hypothetical protein